MSSTFLTASSTPFPTYRLASLSRSSSASCSPVDAPDGTAARPRAPDDRMTSASTVGLPRESRISRAPISMISVMLAVYLEPASGSRVGCVNLPVASGRTCGLGGTLGSLGGRRIDDLGDALHVGRGRALAAGGAQGGLGDLRLAHGQLGLGEGEEVRGAGAVGVDHALELGAGLGLLVVGDQR